MPRCGLNPALLPLVQYYSIELMPLDQGGLFVGISATLCEEEGELSNVDMIAQRVDTPAHALALINEATLFAADAAFKGGRA